MLSPIFDAFVEASPVSVMMRVLMENIFNSSRMNQLFENKSVRQYSQELLFSTQVDLMSLVVCGIYPSVHAAYQKKAVEISVSATALYNKLQRVELPVSRALVHETGGINPDKNGQTFSKRTGLLRLFSVLLQKTERE